MTAMFRFFAAALLMVTFVNATAQTSGSAGARRVAGYWFEGGLGMVIKPTEPWANGANCTHANHIWVLNNHPNYKQMVAAVIHAKASNAPLSAWVLGCQTYWGGESAPVVHALGVD